MHILARFVQKNIYMFPIFLSFVFFGGGAQAFTEIQKKRLLSWKQQVQKLFRSFPRKSLLELSGYRQQRRYAGFWGGMGGTQQPEGPTRASQVGPVSPNREGWILPGSEPHFGREEGWKSFGNKTPGVGWEGKAAVSLLECVVGAYPTDSHRVPLALNPELPSCTAYPQHWVASFVPACCPLLITSALEFHQKAVNWQKKKKKLEACGGCRAGVLWSERLGGDALQTPCLLTSTVMLDFGRSQKTLGLWQEQIFLDQF